MSWLLSRPALVIGSSIAFVATCGGKAVIDPGGSGTGGTSASAASSMGGSPSTTAPGPTTSAGGAPATLCAQACEAVADCISTDVGTCTTRCGERDEMCAGLHDDYLSCLLTDQQGDCAFRGDCIGEATDYLGCAAGVITTQSCAGPECACSTETAFGAQLLFDCFGPECGCFTDGEPVAKCTNAFAAPCDAGFNCCWALFMLYAVPG